MRHRLKLPFLSSFQSISTGVFPFTGESLFCGAWMETEAKKALGKPGRYGSCLNKFFLSISSGMMKDKTGKESHVQQQAFIET